MIVQPKYRGFICTTAHPAGCAKNVEDMVNSALAAGQLPASPKNVLVLGASGGYGLASRIVAAFTGRARTVGASFERPGAENRTASAGFYNNRAFDLLAEKHGIPAKTLDGDAFSDGMKDETIAACKELFRGGKIDLLIYSLASPKRTDPATGETWSSVIKPVGESYTGKTVDFHTGVVSEVTIAPATEEETRQTVKVMGGEDWALWVNRLREENLLAEGFTTVAYSYIGPALTHAIYKDGTIGKAKDDLQARADELNRQLAPLNGSAYISVNKALVTQASVAIPVVPLYISMLYRIMKQRGIHEGCFEQMERLFRLLYGGSRQTDEARRLRLDDWEMRDDIQREIERLWPQVTTENCRELTDLDSLRQEFFAIFGFGRPDVDYSAEVDIL